VTYNLIHNSYLYTVSSGVGNVALSSYELNLLKDNITTYSGVILQNSDILCLEVDLGYKIKLDSLQLYANNLNNKNDIYFYYKEDDNYNFKKVVTNVSAQAYYATLPEPSIAKYIRCVVSGISIEVFEFKILNNDYCISFGQDGSSYYEYLDDTPIGYEGKSEPVYIYNNCKPDSVDAYVCIDPDPTTKGDYIQLALNKEGPYKGIDAGTIISNVYNNWYSGTFLNTEVVSSTNYLSIASLDTPWQYKYKQPQLSTVDLGFIYNTQTMSLDKDNLVCYILAHKYPGNLKELFKYDILTDTFSLYMDMQPYLSNSYVALYYHSGNACVYVIDYDQVYKHDLNGLPNNITAYTINISSGYISATYKDDNTFIILVSINSTNMCLYEYDVITNNCVEIQSFSLINEQHSFRFCDYNTSTQKLTITAKARGISYGATRIYEYDYITGLLYVVLETDVLLGEEYLKINLLDDTYYIYVLEDNKWWKCYVVNQITKVIEGSFLLNISLFKDINDEAIYNTIIYAQSIIYKSSDGLLNILQEQVYDVASNSNKGNLVLASYFNTSILSQGVYITKVIDFEEANKASYVKVVADLELGKNNISVDENLYVSTIEIKQSNEPPFLFSDIAWCVSSNDLFPVGAKLYDIHTDTYKDLGDLSSSLQKIVGISENRCNCNRIFIKQRATSFNIELEDISGKSLHAANFTANDVEEPYEYIKVLFTLSDNIVFLLPNLLLAIYSSDLSSKHVLYLNYLTDFCVHYMSDYIFYTCTSQSNLTIIGLDTSLIFNISLQSPSLLCSAEENSCWVVSTTASNSVFVSKYRVNLDEPLISILMPSKVISLTEDKVGGFFVALSFNNGEIRHYSAKGTLIYTKSFLNNVTYLQANTYYCIVYNKHNHSITYINNYTRNIDKILYYSDFIPSNTFTYEPAYPIIFSHDFNVSKREYALLGTILPRKEDPFWNTSVDNWSIVPKDNYFLKRLRFLQIKLTLISKNFGEDSSVPYIKSIGVVPSLKVSDIRINDSKAIYVRSKIPAQAVFDYFDSKLRVWWDI